MECNMDSVYHLVTSLCEHYSKNKRKLKENRSKCFEVLLGFRFPEEENEFKNLEGTDDAMIHLLAWCFELRQNHGLPSIADDLERTGDQLKCFYKDELGSFRRILTFLLHLRNVPKKSGKILDLSTLPEIDEEISNFNSMFQLPSSITDEYKCNDIFQLSHSLTGRTEIQTKHTESKTPSQGEIIKDEGYSSPRKESIWEVAQRMQYSQRRSWESYGCGPPDKEKPFLSELGDLQSLWVENLESLYVANKLFPSFTTLTNKMRPRKIFIRDLKYLLVGMPSETFLLTSHDEFLLANSIMVEGITPDAIERYCSDFLFSGSCYRALNLMATLDPHTRQYKYSGYVYSELCESISRYLQFYRTAVLSVPDDINYLVIHEKTRHIQMQISALASICKIGPFACDSELIPHGVDLLNYLYQKVLGLCDQKLRMVLYSILYPCCQIYVSRFLHPWITKGILNDPYGEFFVSGSHKYLSSRGRPYWTKSYGIKEDIIPDFLIDLKDDVLFCGKIMNLLYCCNSMNKLCVYLMGKNPLVFTCCLNHEKLTELEHNCSKYYLEASMECGSKFTLAGYLEKGKENDMEYLRLVVRQRALTLRRIEVERQKQAIEQQEKKMEELALLREQYEAAMVHKKLNMYREIEKEIRIMEDDLRIEQIRETLIEEEASKMIEHYAELCLDAEERKNQIQERMKELTKIHLDEPRPQIKSNEYSEPKPVTVEEAIEIPEDKSNSSSETFYSVDDDNETTAEDNKPKKIHSSESMDVLNANVEEKLLQQTIDNFETARKIKQKVLTDDFGLIIGDHPSIPIKEKIVELTAAQKNKLKVLSSEFGLDHVPAELKTIKVATLVQLNRNRVLGHTDFLHSSNKLDNESFLNKNTNLQPLKKSYSLQLDFEKNPTKQELDKPIPMSVDSTPMSELPPIATPLSDYPRSVTPSSFFTDAKLDSLPTTAEIDRDADIFSFRNLCRSNSTAFCQKLQETHTLPRFSKRVTRIEAEGICKNSLKFFLHESISVPLRTQLKLANNEVLKYFIEELGYLDHLESLRDYFFLQDGEFGRNITENLFVKLYSAAFPMELINCRTLQHLVFGALDNSSKYQENSKHLSFKVNSLPENFDLGNPDVLDCLSLSYKVSWPLNILLPSETISKYEQVFKFLIKLIRVSWVLKKILLDLKCLAKETGKKETFLMSSPQYRRIHQCRHVMTHFITTFQNYIVGEVLQPSWASFEKKLTSVNNIDELYIAHTAYIKDILFRCMLNQKSQVLRNIIHKIFIVILKFYDRLRYLQWSNDDGAYVHPNFEKLQKIFENFEDFSVYFYRVSRKVVKSGYQPHLVQFLDVLDVNEYYSNKLSESISRKILE